ncbi:hypothetical protein ACIHBQ_03540 [Streptomyces sp. NPDC052492]|uniref:hypothetical protein n=1 Tax=unclassified Streptomyces TaxID=2593676 RepID=UPI0037D60BDC
MNTERPDHDDEPRPAPGDAPDTGGAPQEREPGQARADAADRGVSGSAPSGGPAEDSSTSEAEAAEATEPRGAGAAVTGTGTGEAAPAGRPKETEPGAEPSVSPAEATADQSVEPSGVEDSGRPGKAATGAGASETRPSEAGAPAPAAADPAAGDAQPSADAEEPGRPGAAGAGPGASAGRAEEPAAGEERGSGGAGSAGAEPVLTGARGPSGAGEPAAGRRRSPVLVASVAAAVLLVGGGGAYLAAGAGEDKGAGTAPGANGDPTPPPLALDGFSESGPNAIAPGEPNPYGATYRADGTLPDGPDTAPVYHARGQVTEDKVVALAKALGMEGRPVAEGASWRIGGQDGSGPTLRVDQQAPGTWTFSRNIPGGDNCKGATCKAPSGTGGPAVSEAAAKKAAAPVLKAVGQDEAKLDASQLLDGRRVVNADPVVGGLPTYGWTTGVVVGAGGEVVGGSGRLAEPVKGDTYPVVGADEALASMNGAPGAGDRVEIGGCATPVPLEDGQGQEEPCAPATKPAGDTVSVDDAVFGLAAHSVDGRPALVPSWLFEVRPAGSDSPFTVTHPAVAPSFLASPTGSGEQPGERPSRPGDEPTSAPAARDVAVEGYTAEGDELTVTFSGGVCADYEATASESGGRVTVKVTETPWPDKVCIMIAKQYQQTVRLDAPLGDREVVDARGEPVPLHKEGARLPAPRTR